MRIGWLALAAVMTTGASALADEPAATPTPTAHGAGWDDSHMQARYQETPRSKRPRITGESGYGALASGSAAASKEVSEKIEFTSQRQWVQGPLSTSSARKPKTSPSATSGDASSGISRGSALRAGSVSSGRRRSRH
jgi:hypothetical protein